MRSKLLVISIFAFFNFTSYSQTFSLHHFKYTGNCNLENALNTVDEKGNKVTVYQCLVQSPAITIYRVNVITFKENITDTDEYLRTLKIEYSKLGSTSSTTLNGIRAVQVKEDVNIQGYSMKQISTATIYKNKSITLVLVTNSPSYDTLLTDFQSQFVFL